MTDSNPSQRKVKATDWTAEDISIFLALSKRHLWPIDLDTSEFYMARASLVVCGSMVKAARNQIAVQLYQDGIS